MKGGASVSSSLSKCNSLIHAEHVEHAYMYAMRCAKGAVQAQDAERPTPLPRICIPRLPSGAKNLSARKVWRPDTHISH